MSTIIRVEKNKNYTTMGNFHLREKQMSLKAIGLLSKILSLPDNWDYSIAGLVSICKENESAIKSALNELKDFGYLQIIKKMPNQTQTGRIEYEYIIYEQPKKQELENLALEIQDVENQRQLNTKKLNTNNNIFNNINIIKNGKNLEDEINDEIKEKKKKEKQSKKMKDNILINEMLENYTSNEEVKNCLKEYLEIRRKKLLTPEQWKIILDDLRKFCGTDKDLAISKIKKAIAGGWMQIVYLDNFNSKNVNMSYSARKSFDNTSNHNVPKGVADMNETEYQEFKNNDLSYNWLDKVNNDENREKNKKLIN